MSMIPGTASVETGLSINQSALRKASSDYCAATVDEGWVDDSGGLAGLANILIHGQSKDGAGRDYASRIGATSAAPSLVLARIVTDTQAARAGLLDVSREANAVLLGDETDAADRTDVMSYERALVRAQMAYRSFSGALDEVEARPDVDVDTGPVASELEAFSDVIDDARVTADDLADKYAALNSSVS